ncbi:MAG: RsmE family RNA methyltransferase [Desulforegulaceae bacterium]|nr:RsmE family RNA methyltransferase [Desulforegulaceae bacterium]
MFPNKTIIRVKRINEKPGFFICEKRLIELWKARKGEALTVMDESLAWHRARFEDFIGDYSLLKPIEKIKSPEAKIFISLFQAVPEKERMELIIEKAAELGVMEIIPVITSKSSCISKRDEKQKKSHNWPKIALKASKQCRRGSILKICSEKKFLDCFYNCNNSLILFLNEKENLLVLKDVDFSNIEYVHIFNGPEGGFSDIERSWFQKNKAVSVSLGPRILRTETAAIFSCSYLSCL